MNKVVVILSGGMDSTVLAYDAASRGYSVHALSFDYGQKHSKELQCAKLTAAALRIPHEVVNLTSLAPLLASALTTPGAEIPEGHYAAENMRTTVVPNRNTIMLSIALGYAITVGAKIVAYGAHAGDHSVYPDCRPEFIKQISKLAEVCHYDPINIWVPYMHISKNEIAILGKGLKVPFENTWTCYVGGDTACGKCGSCVERAEAMKYAGLEDPLYAN